MITLPKEPAVRVTTPSDREVRTERVFNASRERVWRAFTDPKLVVQWWGRGKRLIIESMELERGGRWRYIEHAPDGVHGFEGRLSGSDADRTHRPDVRVGWNARSRTGRDNNF